MAPFSGQIRTKHPQNFRQTLPHSFWPGYTSIFTCETSCSKTRPSSSIRLPQKLFTIRQRWFAGSVQRRDPFTACTKANEVDGVLVVNKAPSLDLLVPRHEPGKCVVVMVAKLILLGLAVLEEHLEPVLNLLYNNTEEATKAQIGASVIVQSFGGPPGVVPFSISTLSLEYSFKARSTFMEAKRT